MKADLHNHSYYSDGVLSPTQLVRLAKKQGCDMFALTDHDTTEGINEAQIEADAIGLKLIHGVEISALWSNTTVHILGLNVDKNSTTLQQGLKQHQGFRKLRAEKIARELAAAGVINPLAKVEKIAKTHMITRTHFAQMLINEGICKDMNTVFKRFLTGKKPGGVKGRWAEFAEVISWIKNAKGLAVLAHPLRYRMTRTKIRRLVDDFSNAGGDGIEAITATSSNEEVKLVSQWADEFGLLLSIGSDYHGWANQRIKIGQLYNPPQSHPLVWDYF